MNASDIIEEWYFNEEPLWNYDEPILSDETRDFSQIVWNGTVRFGCGQAVSEGQRGGTYTVCYYDPPGNVAGLERENVQRPRYGEDDEDEGEDVDTEGARAAIRGQLNRGHTHKLNDGNPLSPIIGPDH